MPVTGEVWSRLLSQIGGNPLYAEEYARMLVEGAPEGELPLPESVHALIAARLDVLGRDAKAVLQDAAVVGKEFWVSLLEQLAGLPRQAVEARVAELERKGFVSAQPHSAVADEAQYAFSHVLIRDIAYGQIPRSRRTEKHRVAGDWIAALAPDRASNLAERPRTTTRAHSSTRVSPGSPRTSWLVIAGRTSGSGRPCLPALRIRIGREVLRRRARAHAACRPGRGGSPAEARQSPLPRRGGRC